MNIQLKTALDSARLAPIPAPAGIVHLPHPSKALRRILCAVAALLLIGAAAAYWLSSAQPAARYMTATIGTGSVTRVVSGSGTVNPVLTIIVGTYVSGVIQSISCDFNTKVTKGQLCAKIDPSPYQTAVDQAAASLATTRAQLVKDQANLTYAESAYQRNTKLLVIGGVSQDTAEIAKNAYEQAKAQIVLDEASIRQHQAALNAAQVNLGYTNIVSPVNGTVVSRNMTVGQTVAASFQTPTLFLIATDLTKMQVDTNVSESDIGSISLGNTASFTIEAYPGKLFRGVVTQIRQAPQTVQNVVTYDVIVAVDNSDLLLKPGMTATTRIVTASRENVLRVPDQALRFSPGARENRQPKSPALPAGQGRVWVLQNGQPQTVPVTLGLDDDTNTEVTRGELRTGDLVITGTASGTTANSSATARPRIFGF